jgi:Dolichyl-phosphate-mannose-protein mannosyltransferase
MTISASSGWRCLRWCHFFNFWALKFNVNTILMPLWAAMMFFLLRSYRTRGAGLAALAGPAVGACVLAKYWSLILLANFAVTAAIDLRRADYSRSPALFIFPQWCR